LCIIAIYPTRGVVEANVTAVNCRPINEVNMHSRLL